MKITVEFSEAALFGSTDTDDYDVEGSIAQFAESLENHIYDAYPKAEIKITKGINDRVRIDGSDDHEEAPWVNQIIDRVFNGDDWAVGK